MSVNKDKHCGRTFGVPDAPALVRYGRENRRATVPEVTKNVNKKM